MSNVQNLLIKELAHAFLPKLNYTHKCGFFDGGCLSLAIGIHNAFPDQTQVCVASDQNGVVHHGLVKIKDHDLFGDANGWQSKAAFIENFQTNEKVTITKIDAIDLTNVSQRGFGVQVFDDIVQAIEYTILETDNIHCHLPVEVGDQITITTNPFDRNGSAITSNLYTGCEGIPGGFADGIESMVLSHFQAGVDVFGAKYCQGILDALQGAVNGLPDCECNACQLWELQCFESTSAA